MHNTDANHGRSGMTAGPCEDSRAKFEHWYSDEGASPRAVERNGDGYRLMQAQEAWRAWQAAMTAATGQAPLFSLICTKCKIDRLSAPCPDPQQCSMMATPYAANGQAVPEGWKLVPLEANDDMVTAACEAANLFRVDAVRAIEAAIAAAPQGEKK